MQPSYAQKPQTIRPVIGWAVVENLEIKIKTVSDTRRAAIVNFLVTERDTMILNSMTDEMIERIWFQRRQGAEVEYVTISYGALN